MSALLLILAVLSAVVLGDAVVENTSPDSATLFGQQITGLTQGGLLLAAAGLGALIAFLIVAAMAATRRRRARRRDLRSSSREMEDRVVDLERENAALRSQVPAEPHPLDEPAEPFGGQPTTGRYAAATPVEHRPDERPWPT